MAETELAEVRTLWRKLAFLSIPKNRLFNVERRLYLLYVASLGGTYEPPCRNRCAVGELPEGKAAPGTPQTRAAIGGHLLNPPPFH